MKVLMTADTVGGVWVYALELARALEPHGVQVVLATKGARLTAVQRREVRHHRNVELAESEYRLEWMESPWEDVDRAGEWLLDLERAHRPDVVHLNDYAGGSLPFRAPHAVVGHSCVRSWWEAVRGTAVPNEWDEYTRRVRAGLAGARVVVAPSRHMLDALERHYGPLTTTRVIHNGRDARRFPPGVKEPFVFAAGRLWDEAKNVAALDRIADALPWRAYVAGHAASPDGHTNGFAAVSPVGHLASGELADWLGRASIYVLPARYEPFGLSVLEAALAGCALVLGDIPSLRELWGDAATYVDPHDDRALLDATRWLCEDTGLRRALAARARRRALELTPWHMGRRYMEVYESLRYARSAHPEVVACAS